MKVLQHINKLFYLFFVFCIGTESYSQREIHPLEPMFTYDYALKYYSNLPIKSFLYNDLNIQYCFLDNFRCPQQIDTILLNKEYYTTEEVMEYHEPIAKLSNRHLHFYDKNTGFLERSIFLRFSDDSMKIDTLKVQNYSYKVDGNLYKILKKSSNEQTSYEYIFDKKSENLLKLVKNKFDTVYFSYDEDHTWQVSSVYFKNEYIDVYHRLSTKEGKTISSKDISIDDYNYNIWCDFRDNKISSDIKYSIHMAISKNSFSHYRQGNLEMSYSQKNGSLVFDNAGKLKEYHIKSIPYSNHPYNRKHFDRISKKNKIFYDGYNISLIRKGTKKWVLFYNYERSSSIIKKRKDSYVQKKKGLFTAGTHSQIIYQYQ